MNKLRRRLDQIPFPKVEDPKGPFYKGALPGNMMGYKARGAEPETSHVSGKMPGNRMAYQASKNPPGESLGIKPLSEPTRSGFSGKTMPKSMGGYEAVNPNKSEWTQIQSQRKPK